MKSEGLKSEAIHETGLSGNVVTSFFPLIIFILLCFNVLSTVPRENRLADFLYIYISKRVNIFHNTHIFFIKEVLDYTYLVGLIRN